MAGEFRALKPEEEALCRENDISTEGKVVILSNDRGLWLLNHKTRDTLHIGFGEARMRKNAVPVRARLGTAK